jgi:hypothetical protein
MGVNVGRTGVLTVIFNVVVLAHCPGFGVNVYADVPREAVLTAGAHAPVITGVFVDPAGRIGAVAF